MAFSMTVGLVVVVLGLSSILVAWLHPAPDKTFLGQGVSLATQKPRPHRYFARLSQDHGHWCAARH